MSLLTDPAWQAFELTDFASPSLLLDEESKTGAAFAYNVTYLPGQLQTRPGFGLAYSMLSAIPSLYNWVQSLYNRLLFYNKATLQLGSRDMVSGIDSLIANNIVCDGIRFAQAGSRIEFVFFDAAGQGALPAKIWSGLYTNDIPDTDNLFQCPLDPSQFTMTATELAAPAGVVSKGSHNFGIVFRTRNGYTTKPVPSSNTGTPPLTFTATGGKQIQINVAPVGVWPEWVDGLEILMTTVQNPQRYFFVPDGLVLNIGSNFAPNILVNVDDVTLGEVATDAQPWFNLRCGDLNAHGIVEYGQRIVYLARIFDANVINNVAQAYVSEPDNPQWITEDQHVIRLPGGRDIVTAFVLGKDIYWVGPNWTFVSSDNGGLPVEWAPPQLIDGTIGTQFPGGIFANPSKGFAWVADQSGLFLFQGGAYPNRPISWNQTPDWKRINWTAPKSALQIVDDNNNRRVMVMAPLDGATKATHIFVWDYTFGVDAESARYSLWNVADFNIGALALVSNQTSKESEPWISCADDDPGTILRLLPYSEDPATYSDNGSGIDSRYRGVAVPDVFAAPVRHHGAHLRLRGSGAIQPSIHSFDGLRSQFLAPVPASMTPGRDYLRLASMQSEAARYEVGNGALDRTFFILAMVQAYWSQWVSQR